MVKQQEMKREERRRKTMKTMSASATSSGMKALLEDTIAGIADNIAMDGTAEERLQKIMTAAKETGMAVGKIFSYFTDNPQHFTKEEFKSGLAKIGEKHFNLTDDEVDEIITKFDIDGDGTISTAEFKIYCYYHIPGVAWKAERKRMEMNGEMDKLKAIVAGHAHHEEDEEDEVQHHPEDVQEEMHVYPCGEMVFKTTKLFWRTNTTVEVRLYYQVDTDVITIQVFNQTEDREMPCLYVLKKSLAIDAEAMDEQIKVAVQTSPPDTPKQAIEDKVKWEFYSSYILARLKLPDSSNPFPVQDMKAKLPPLSPRTESIMPFLCKLSDDKFESLMINKPLNIMPPSEIPKEVAISVDEFMSAFSEFSEASAKVKGIRSSAEKMSKLVAMSINAFNNAEHDLQRRRAMSKQQRMWAQAFTRWIVKKQCEEVRKVLESSPAYQLLLQEQEEKKAAATTGLGGGSILPTI